MGWSKQGNVYFLSHYIQTILYSVLLMAAFHLFKRMYKEYILIYMYIHYLKSTSKLYVLYLVNSIKSSLACTYFIIFKINILHVSDITYVLYK